MKKVHVISLVLITLLVASAMVQTVDASSYWDRIAEGFSNPVVVHEYVYEYRAEDLEITARIPQLVGAFDTTWQGEFNQNLRERLDVYLLELKELAQVAWELEQEFRPFPYEAIVDFEVKLNQGGLLSIAIVNYAYLGGAHGMTVFTYVNLDLTTGQTVRFEQLFNTDVELERAANVIHERIVAEPDWFFIDEFTVDLFNEDQDFYLQDTRAVICFGHYELAPYSSGIQEFAIPAP